MEEALVSHLLAQAGLTALVGTRVHWVQRPQATELPAVTLAGISRVPNYAMSGATGLASSRVQIDCWAQTYGGSKLVAREVQDVLSGARITRDGIVFQGVFQDSERDGIEDAPGGKGIYRTSMDFIAWHGQA